MISVTSRCKRLWIVPLWQLRTDRSVLELPVQRLRRWLGGMYKEHHAPELVFQKHPGGRQMLTDRDLWGCRVRFLLYFWLPSRRLLLWFQLLFFRRLLLWRHFHHLSTRWVLGLFPLPCAVWSFYRNSLSLVVKIFSCAEKSTKIISANTSIQRKLLEQIQSVQNAFKKNLNKSLLNDKSELRYIFCCKLYIARSMEQFAWKCFA